MNPKILFSILFLPLFIYSQWTVLNSGTSQTLRSISFIDLQTGFACGVQGTIVKTTNGGTNWIAQSSGTTYELRSIQFINNSTGFAAGFSGPSGGIIIKSTDAGSSWQQVYTSPNQLLALSFANNLTGVCSGNSGTTLYTTNGGSNWGTGQPTGFLVTFYTAFMLNSTTGYTAGVNTIFSPLFAKTTDGGMNWVYSSFYVNNNEATVHRLYFFDNQIGIAVTVLWDGRGGISKTTNGGANWTHQIFTNALYGVDFPASLTGYACGFNGTILKSTDGGNNWIQQTTPNNSFLRAIDFVDSLNGFAAGDGGAIFKTTNGGIVPVINNHYETPDKFSLSQNYPNPFNPTTHLRFGISELRFVKLVVYDVLGREVQILVNEELSPGIYEVEFPVRQSLGTGGDGTNLPSGVYYYKLRAGDFIEIKKMVLLR